MRGSNTGRVFLYFTPLTLLVFFVMPNGYLLDIATSFMLKNRLNATPEQIANFRLVTAIPVYLSFASAWPATSGTRSACATAGCC